MICGVAFMVLFLTLLHLNIYIMNPCYALLPTLRPRSCLALSLRALGSVLRRKNTKAHCLSRVAEWQWEQDLVQPQQVVTPSKGF